MKANKLLPFSLALLLAIPAASQTRSNTLHPRRQPFRR